MKQTNARLAACLLKGLIFLLSISLTTASCDLFRKAETSKPPKRDRPTDAPNASTQPKPPTSTVLVDTIRWKTDPKAIPPITTGTPPSTGGVVVTPGKPGGQGNVVVVPPTDPSKTVYNMSFLLPFYTANFKEGTPNPANAQFALDFYAGAKLAFDSLSRLPFNLNINVLDSRGDFNSIISRYEISKSDVVIGPVEKENIALAIPFSTRNGIPFVSPYFPTGDVEGTNTNFVQVKPSLKTHCANIIRHIRNNYNIGQAILVARSKDNETGRFAFFQEANKSWGGGNIDEWRIEDETNFNIEPYIEKTGTTVFVIPSWNEPFVTSILRKLNASPRRGQVVVYGMPQWMDFDRSLYTLYDALKVRVSSSTFIDGNSPDVKAFRNRFMAKYGKLPNSDSFLGYDCAMYFGNQLFKYGKSFPGLLEREQESVLHTKFYFTPVYNTATTADDLGSNIMKLENQFVNILRYQAGVFKLDE